MPSSESVDATEAARAGLARIAGEVDAETGRLKSWSAESDLGSISSLTDSISTLTASAVRLYAAASESCPDRLSGAELKLTPTEAVIMASALLRSQQLTPFEFSIWFSQSRAARGMEG